MTNQSEKSGAISHRLARMNNPRPVATGTINTGFGKYKCTKCGYQFDRSRVCPKCQSKDIRMAGAEKLRWFEISGIDQVTKDAFDKLYRGADGKVRPRRLKCTFIQPPWDAVRVGFECWQKGGLFCYNHWEFSPRTFLWEQGPYATRRPKGMLRTITNQPCDPSTCPYSIGGEVEEKGARITIDPGRTPCKSKITMQLFLVGMPGLNFFRYSSTSRHTIEACMLSIQKMLMLMRGNWVMLEFDLVLAWKEYARPPSRDQAGNAYFPKTEGPVVSIEIPVSIGELSAGSIVHIPGLSEGGREATRALPAAAEREPDPIVDLMHEVEPEAPRPASGKVEFGDVEKIEHPPKPSTPDLASTEKVEELQGLVREYSGGSSSAGKMALSKAKKSHGLKGRKVSSLNEDEVYDLIAHFKALLQQKETSQYPLETDNSTDLL